MAPRNKEGKNRKNSLNDMITRKLAVFFLVILLAFIMLIARLFNISFQDGEKYKKQVLSQQKYDNKTIHYKRGSIVDRNGTVLAYSAQVYNVILDTKRLNSDPESIEPTLVALNQCFNIDPSEVRNYMRDNPNNKYHILVKEVPYDQVTAYEEAKAADDSQISAYGIWFEKQYKRSYPYGSLAADVIGFTTGDDIGQYGLEQYYNDVLAGSDGREYGYLTGGNALERTTIPAVNGNTICTTIDAYIQGICEEKILEFNMAHYGEYREGEPGSDNTGVIIMDVHTGEVLAMASYPTYDLNDPYDLSAFYSAEEIQNMKDNDTYYEACNDLWKNFCISQSYEPGSVCKTFTVAAALDSGAIHDTDTYMCNGYISFGEGDHEIRIRCHSRYGEGLLTVKGAIEVSCNVALIQIGQKMGVDAYLKYFKNFGFGLKTNIDLAGEMRTSSLVFTKDTMGPTELATSTFGQGFNVTMIQTISAFCSLVNGGYYYQPHMVNKIMDDNGNTVETIDPVLLRQTVSSSVSDLLRDYCIGVVEEGTGTYARPAGYKIGGKTGTAEHSGQGKIDYVVSFMGFAPADDPQIAIYVVIDRPNSSSQDTATRWACLLCREILTDVLPYKNIYMTEPLSEKEQQELEERGSHVFTVSNNSVSDNSVSDNAVSENSVSENNVPEPQPAENNETETNKIVIDPVTGYAIDPVTGEYLDPDTLEPINNESSTIFEGDGWNTGVSNSNTNNTEPDTGPD